MRGLLPGRWHQPEATALKTWARLLVIAWVLVVVPLMAFSLLLMVVALPRLLATAWASLGEQADRLGADFGDGDVLGVLARLLAIVALVVPLLGIGYVLVRLVRRTAVGVWRRTEGRPVRRGLALLLAAALVAGLAWAWWPVDDRYRPVQAWEGGTVLDAVPAASSSGLEEGTRGTAATVWPADAGPLPTEDNPVLALVLVPASQGVAEGSEGTTGGAAEGEEGAAPTWVFPFDRPLPPAEGDNQALAVNTEDGSVLYDVSFALVWADGDEALNVNEAYALASCQDCRTVAVAFQVVLLVGSVDVVVPQNLSAAVNYACIECVTYALATQLVVSLPGELSADGQEALAAIWAELQEFGENIEDVPLAELRDRLTEFEERILDVVQEHAEDSGETPAEADDPDTGTSDDGTAGTGTDDGTSDGPPTGPPTTETTRRRDVRRRPRHVDRHRRRDRRRGRHVGLDRLGRAHRHAVRRRAAPRPASRRRRAPPRRSPPARPPRRRPPAESRSAVAAPKDPGPVRTHWLRDVRPARSRPPPAVRGAGGRRLRAGAAVPAPPHRPRDRRRRAGRRAARALAAPRRRARRGAAGLRLRRRARLPGQQPAQRRASGPRGRPAGTGAPAGRRRPGGPARRRAGRGARGAARGRPRTAPAVGVGAAAAARDRPGARHQRERGQHPAAPGEAEGEGIAETRERTATRPDRQGREGEVVARDDRDVRRRTAHPPGPARPGARRESCRSRHEPAGSGTGGARHADPRDPDRPDPRPGRRARRSPSTSVADPRRGGRAARCRGRNGPRHQRRRGHPRR